MKTYGNTVTAIKYMSTVLGLARRKSFTGKLTNRDFYTPGDNDPKTTKSIKNKMQQFVITSLHSNGWSTYSGSDLSFTAVKEVVSTLTINTYKALQDKIMSIATFTSSVDDPKSAIMESAGGKLVSILDKAMLAMYADAGAGNWVGTSYTTGTVTVTTGTGAVTGSGTTFTAAMVGRPFKAAGHTKWYRVLSYASATSIVIENDEDDQATSYDGGTISAGAAYEIQAATVLAVTKTNIAAALSSLSTLLSEAHGDHDELSVPEEGRFCLLPTAALNALRTAAEFNRDIEIVYNDTVVKGLVAKAYGMEIYTAPSAWFQGNNTTGFYCIAGHKNWLTAGYGFIEPISIIDAKDNQTNFGDLIKGLFGYGFKVADDRRAYGAVLYATFA